MNKLRSDSAFCQLTPEQVDALEGWLFEERLGYPKVVKKLKAEFGLETSLTGVRRYYKRLDLERSRQSLVDVVETSGWAVEALKGGNLKPGMMLLANKCAFELMMKPEPPIRKVTALLRAITSAEARAFRQTVDDREQAELRERERVRRVEEERSRVHWRIKWEDEEEQRQKRAARKKAKQEAAEKAAKESENTAKTAMSVGCSPSPQPSPPGEGEELAQRVVCELSARGSASGDSRPEDRTGNLSGAPASLSAVALAKADGTAQRDAGGAWQPSVVEEPGYAENHLTEAAENRLTPLNAA